MIILGATYNGKKNYILEDVESGRMVEIWHILLGEKVKESSTKLLKR